MESEPKPVELGRLSRDVDSEIMSTQLVIWHGRDRSSLRLLPLFFAEIKVSDSEFDQSYESEDSECTFIPRCEIEVEEATINSRGGDSCMKQTGMLVVSLRGANFGFWSRLGCSEQSANILSRQGLV